MSRIATDHHYSAGTTVKIAVAGSVVSLSDPANLAIIQPTTGSWAGYSATAVWITCITSGLYFSFGADPDTAGLVGHPFELGVLLELKNFKNISVAKFIRQGAVSGAMMVTPFFNDTGKA